MGRKIMEKLKQAIIRNLYNLPGWHSNRKIVVIESDDWGSIRMPSREVYNTLLSKGIRVDKFPYNRYDSLASETDLSALFEVLSSVKDRMGNNAIVTANTIVTNPNFDRIRQSNFEEYSYEPFTESLKGYSAHAKSFNLWKEGIAKGIFMPQFHGREHINVIRWMKALRDNIGNVRLAFDYRMYDLSTSYTISKDSFMDTFNFEEKSELTFQKQSIIDGTKLFESIFGYKSKTFIAPVYIWSNTLNETLKNCGVSTFQGNYYQLEPLGKVGKYRKILHYTGQTNRFAQISLVRNASFEPSEKISFDWIGCVTGQIANSFFWRKPAIISSHRMNYIGFIDPMNSSRNLKLLKNLLNEILKKWPDVEFMSSQQLSNLIHNNE